MKNHDKDPSEMFRNGALHRVDCHWCGLKMACNCWLAKEKYHIIILCPKCQVTEFTNLLFGRTSASEEPEPGRDSQGPHHTEPA